MRILEDSIKRIFVAFSGGASLARYLMEHVDLGHDPTYGRDYIIVGGFTDKADASGIDFFREHDIPVIVGTFEEFKQNNDTPTPWKDYFAYYGQMIKTHYDPDLIFCCGFMKVIKKPFFDLFPGIILNVHPADLRITDPGTGKRLYIGGKAVELAYNAREPYMYSTVNFMIEEIDAGEIVCVSEPYEVDYDNQTWEEVQSEMKYVCDGPAGIKAMKLFCCGEYPFN